MKSSAKKLLEQIVLQELDLLHEQLWGDNGIGPKEKKQFVDKLKTMFSCLYDDVYNEIAKGPLSPQGIVDKLYDTIINTDKYQDYNYDIRCYGKGHVYELVTNELNKEDDSKKQDRSLGTWDWFKLYQKKATSIDPNNIVFPANKLNFPNPPIAGQKSYNNISFKSTRVMYKQIVEPIRKFPNRKQGRWAYISWTGPGGVSADKIIQVLKKLDNFYDVEEIVKYYTVHPKFGYTTITPAINYTTLAFKAIPPKMKKGAGTAKENNFLYLIQNTDIIKQIKSKTSISERFKVVSYILSNVLTTIGSNVALMKLFDFHDRVDAMQVMVGDPEIGSVKDISDLGGRPDQNTIDGYNKMFTTVYKTDLKDYTKSYIEMQKDPYGSEGRKHLYKYNMFRGYDENRHFYNNAAAFAAFLVPFVGTAISSTIFAMDADQSFNEGDKVGGTIGMVFALMPGIGAIVNKVPGVRQLGAKGMYALSEKFLAGSGKVAISNLEKQVLQGLSKYKDLIGKELAISIEKNAQNFLKSYLQGSMKVAPWVLKAALYTSNGIFKTGKLAKTLLPYFMIQPSVEIASTSDWWKDWEDADTQEAVENEIKVIIQDKTISNEKKQELERAVNIKADKTEKDDAAEYDQQLKQQQDIFKQ